MFCHHKIRCYSCHEPVKGTLYIEREINPYTYVPICERCAPTWHLINRLEKKQFIEYVPRIGVRLTQKTKQSEDLGKLERKNVIECKRDFEISRLLKDYKNMQ